MLYCYGIQICWYNKQLVHVITYTNTSYINVGPSIVQFMHVLKACTCKARKLSIHLIHDKITSLLNIGHSVIVSCTCGNLSVYKGIFTNVLKDIDRLNITCIQHIKCHQEMLPWIQSLIIVKHVKLFIISLFHGLVISDFVLDCSL